MTFPSASRLPHSVRVTALGFAALSLPLMVGCGSSSTSDTQSGMGSSGDLPAVVSSEGLVIIDVRTPAEFSEQRLDGALNINLQSSDFVDRISQLDRNGNYAVYCRSGNRSAEAVAAMRTLGFTNVTDHGSVAEASGSLGVTVIS
jgi:phage shock protein E